MILSNKAVLYARFSSDNQRSESIDAQIRAMTAYCKQNNIQIVDTYIDEAKSATTDRRPAFQQMIKDSSNHMFNLVLVHKLDRFARNRYDSAVYRRELKKNGVKVYSVVENLDSSPESIMLESVLEGMNEYYSENLAREVRKGLKENALQCKHNGGKPPLGYDVDPVSKRLVINPVEADIVKTIFTLYANGHGYNDIIHILSDIGAKTKCGGSFKKNSLYSILTNRKYSGVYVYNRAAARDVDGTRNNHLDKEPSDIIVVVGGCPQIVDTETFDKVQDKLNSHKHKGGKSNAKHRYLLSGKLFCKDCGRAMVGNTHYGGRSNSLIITYRCPHKSNYCYNKEINRDYLESYVVSLLEKEVFNTVAAGNIVTAIGAEREQSIEQNRITAVEMQKTLSRLQEEIDNITDAIAQGLFSPALAERITTLEEEKSRIEVERTKLNNDELSDNNYIDPSFIVSKYDEIKNTPASPEYKSFICDFISSIVIGRYSVDITLKTGLNVCDSLDKTYTVRRQEIYSQNLPQKIS